MNKRAYLIGWPVAHSLSPLMHEAAYEALGLEDWFYSSLAVKPSNLQRTLRELLADEATVGVNVTLPHKEAVLDLVPAASRTVHRIGAANTLARTTEGVFSCHNTDVAGFAASMLATGAQPVGRALFLGAGGSARACALALQAQGLRDLGIVCRRPEQGRRLLADLALGEVDIDASPSAAATQVWSWQAMDEALSWLSQAPCSGLNPGLAALVNTTPVGMWPRPGASPLALQQLDLLSRDCLVVDLIYRPRPTRLLREAVARGLPVVDGLEMLVRQGFAALGLWLGCDPGQEALKAMRRAVESALEGDVVQCSVL